MEIMVAKGGVFNPQWKGRLFVFPVNVLLEFRKYNL